MNKEDLNSKTKDFHIGMFGLPTWEEIKYAHLSVFIERKPEQERDFFWKFVVVKSDGSDGCIVFYNGDCHIEFQSSATKENYEKACEIVFDWLNKR